MNIRQLKNIMKEVNEPNEFLLEPDNLQHPLYWIFKIDDVRVKTIFPKLEGLRKPDARFEIFINGLFISDNDYLYENEGNAFYSNEATFLNLTVLEMYMNQKKQMK